VSRQPVHIEAARAGGRPYGRRAVWGAIRKLGAFTKRELRLELPHATKHAVDEYLSALIKAGYVTPGEMVKVPLSTGRERRYHLERDTGVDAPRLKKDGTELPLTAQQLMWMAMKPLGWFSIGDLAGHAGTDQAQVPYEAARSYVRHLHLAGYVRSNTQGSAFRLVKDTGGLAPMVQRTKVVFDPNTNTVAWHEDIEP